MASTYSDFFRGQMDTGLFCSTNLSGETQLSNEEEEKDI
jgi:hypothetical protein